MLQKTLVIFVFADLTPDGFHFWMTLSPNFGTRAPRSRALPLEQNSGDATGQKQVMTDRRDRLKSATFENGT